MVWDWQWHVCWQAQHGSRPTLFGDNAPVDGSLVCQSVFFCLEDHPAAMRNAVDLHAVQRREQTLPNVLYDLMSHIRMRSVDLHDT